MTDEMEAPEAEEKAVTADQAERVLGEIIKEADEPLEPDPSVDRTRELRTPGFSRMVIHFGWDSPDARVVQEAMTIIQVHLVERFYSAFDVMRRLYDIVRLPLFDAQGNVRRDEFGLVLYQQNEAGNYVEDFTLLGARDVQSLLLELTAHMLEWEQEAADAWTQAMFAKGKWEERFSITYRSSEVGGRATVSDRTQHARVESTEDRYNAIFYSGYSRKADALVRSLTLLNQRLKDLL